MKTKLLFSILLFTTLVLNANAQVKYQDVKSKYDHRDYGWPSDRRYSPVLAGFLSAYPIPGLGQMYCGEPKRGLVFMAGWGTCVGIWATGLSNMYLTGTKSGPNYVSRPVLEKYSGQIFLAGALSGLAVRVWASADAAKVAKVKNMAINDNAQTSSINFGFSPYVHANTANSVLSTGLTCRITF